MNTPPFTHNPMVYPPPVPPPSSSFWTSANVRHRLLELQQTINLAKAILLNRQKELELLIEKKEREVTVEVEDNGHRNLSINKFSKFLQDNRIDLNFQESASLNAANDIMSKLQFQLEPFRFVTDEKSPWEEKSAVVRLADKLQKYKRNKLWSKRKRKRIAEKISQEHEQFDKKDKEADDWRGREIAKDMAQRKVEKMNEIAKLKAKEEKRRLESELELVLMVEKLQELRSIRIQKLKKQGHFLPGEDDKFLERVKAAVEEEEHQAMAAAADTDAAKDAIAIAEESRKTIPSSEPKPEERVVNHGGEKRNQDQKTESRNYPAVITPEQGKGGQVSASAYDSVSNLPLEFYHYYHGANTDMGTLIEVRRTWDAYIRPGGSRIPGHWVQRSPPADEIWASYLVNRK